MNFLLRSACGNDKARLIEIHDLSRGKTNNYKLMLVFKAKQTLKNCL